MMRLVPGQLAFVLGVFCVAGANKDNALSSFFACSIYVIVLTFPNQRCNFTFDF